MDPKPSIRKFRREPATASLRCAYCGARAQDGDAFCRDCGHALIVSEEDACLTCGLTGLGDSKHCPGCGSFREIHAPEPVARRPLRRVATMAGLGALLALAVSAATGAWGQGNDPHLAGIEVGDTPAEVERTLGSPEDRGTEVFWQGVDGQSHQMVQWQYGLDETKIADLTVTFIDGKVHQVGALAGDWQTSEGLKIGDRLPKAERIYGTAIEDSPIEGLTPHRYIQGDVVVRVITESPSDEILAIGVESPKQAPLEAAELPSADPHHGLPSEPPSENPHQNVPRVSEDDEPLLPRQRFY